ncbi:MAG: hypothetical protein M1832_002696 [Thelocarpon impressellum]|nr:MAG: hypothetical protein M1832_002696 [Thelocarpon impressellum]
MPAISPDDPLWAIRHGRSLPEHDPLLQQARDLINADPCETLSPEQQAKARQQLHELLRMSRDQAAAASFVARGIEEGGLAQLHHNLRQACMFFRHGTSPAPMSPPPLLRPAAVSPPTSTLSSGASTPARPPSHASQQRTAQVATSPADSSPTKRSSTFSRWVKANDFCRVTGEFGDLHACHILPYVHRNQDFKAANFLDLLGALFGAEAVDVLIRNVLNVGQTTGEGIDRHDNGIALRPHVHSDWDRTHFVLEVDWTTLDHVTGEVLALVSGTPAF